MREIIRTAIHESLVAEFGDANTAEKLDAAAEGMTDMVIEALIHQLVPSATEAAVDALLNP